MTAFLRKLYLLHTFLVLIILLLFNFCSGNRVVRWWSSTEGKPWEEQRNIILQPFDSSTSFLAEIYPDSVIQEIDGFGGCFNEKGWEVIKKLDEAKQNKIFKALFGSEGLHFTIGRLPIGANDYSTSYYSLNDSVGDTDMEFFSIERDKQNIIPYVQKALDVNDDIVFWASPWTPPYWMKTNSHYACAAGANNGLSKKDQGKEGTNQLIQTDSILKAYAKYLIKYVKSYREEGIDITALHVQNEFNSCQVFPSCTWTPGSLGKFIGNYLGPSFEKNRIKSELWLSTIERPDINKIDTILADTNGGKYVKGLGFQWGGKGVVSEAGKKYPQLRLMQTESECGDGSNDWKGAEYTFNLMKHYFNAGVNSYMAWNMVLEKNGKSYWGLKQNALISVDTIGNNFVYNPEFYLYKHFSHFVDPGSERLLVSGKYSDMLAFLNSDKDLIVVMANMKNHSKVVDIKVDKKIMSVTLPSNSFCTLLYTNVR